VNIVTARGLAKEYKGLRAVDHIDFEITRGECFGFLGPNGAGKTTVMSMLYCYILPTAGEIEIFGMDVTKDPGNIKARIGVMPQENNLDPDLTSFENLTVYARYFDIPRKKAAAIASDLLNYVDLEEKANDNVQHLSGGMKRSLLLARSLVNRPELFILDEPTTGLDPHSRQMVWKKLKDLKANGATLLLTTHYMEEAEKLCDRVAIMDMGKIITIDTPQRLMEIHGGNLEDVFLKLTGRALED
jgi:lipooligosaccharide transport system ATP-binding protein